MVCLLHNYMQHPTHQIRSYPNGWEERPVLPHTPMPVKRDCLVKPLVTQPHSLPLPSPAPHLTVEQCKGESLGQYAQSLLNVRLGHCPGVRLEVVHHRRGVYPSEDAPRVLRNVHRVRVTVLAKFGNEFLFCVYEQSHIGARE